MRRGEQDPFYPCLGERAVALTFVAVAIEICGCATRCCMCGTEPPARKLKESVEAIASMAVVLTRAMSG